MLSAPPQDCSVQDNLLFTSGPHSQPVLVVPADNGIRQELLHLVHDPRHFGKDRTFTEATRHFTWKDMRHHVRHFVARCPVCQLQKPGNRTRHALLCPELRFHPYPFHTVVMDVVENLPLTTQGHNAVLTIVDRFTKFAIYVPIHSTWSAYRQAQCLMDQLVYRYHTPVHIHTDNGPAYRTLFKAFCAALGVRHVTGTPYHSQSQGGAERQHRTLLQTLRSTCSNKHQWDIYLQAAAHAYNDSVHAATGYSPFELLYGCPSRLPWHLQLPNSGPHQHMDQVNTYDQRVSSLLEQHRAVYEAVLKNLRRAAESMGNLKSKRRPKSFAVGDKVKVQYGLKGPTDKHKLDPYYVGPYVIKQVLQNGAYQLDLPPGSAFSDRIHVDRLEPWIDSDLTLFPMDEHLQPAAAPLPDTQAMQDETTAYRIRRYLLRDYSAFPAQPVRYWVEGNMADPSQRYFWVDETATLLEEFLPLEEQNGCIPEQGILPANFDAVQTHKKTTYLQSPNPIMANTWPYHKLPYQTRRRPPPPPRTTLLNSVVQELFYLEGQDQPAYFQGMVHAYQDKQYEVLWTDGKKDFYQEEQIKAMLYDPVSYIYDFQL